MRILCKYASRSRPHLLAETLDNWKADVRWIVSLDSDDPTVEKSIEHCRARGIEPIIGTSATKIEAMNRDISGEWDVLVMVSDDMRAADGWLDVVRSHMAHTDMGLWFPDGKRRDLCTLSIIGRKLYERLGCVYHPAFRSVWCDNYYHYAVERWGRLKFVDLPVFRHEWKKENNDALMQRNESRTHYNADRATYEQLKTRFDATGIYL